MTRLRTVLFGATIAFCATSAWAHEDIYDYRVEVSNGLGEEVLLRCTGSHDHELHAGHSTVVKMRAGESLSIECTAFDHHGSASLGHRHFDLDHHHRQAQWSIGGNDHHDDGDDGDGDDDTERARRR